ncbi:MAG: hypothetical protein ACJ79U_02155, partial [Myxococcales bacterium]
IYVADDPSNDADPILAGVSDPAARRTLLATRQAGHPADPSQPSQPRQPGSPEAPTYRFDVILQGEGETAFFDV